MPKHLTEPTSIGTLSRGLARWHSRMSGLISRGSEGPCWAPGIGSLRRLTLPTPPVRHFTWKQGLGEWRQYEVTTP